jgi:hypothetical protein
VLCLHIDTSRAVILYLQGKGGGKNKTKNENGSESDGSGKQPNAPKNPPAVARELVLPLIELGWAKLPMVGAEAMAFYGPLFQKTDSAPKVMEHAIMNAVRGVMWATLQDWVSFCSCPRECADGCMRGCRGPC